MTPRVGVVAGLLAVLIVGCSGSNFDQAKSGKKQTTTPSRSFIPDPLTLGYLDFEKERHAHSAKGAIQTDLNPHLSVESYKISLTLEPQKESFSGEIFMELSTSDPNVKSVALNMGEQLKLDGVTVLGVAVDNYVRGKDTLEVPIPLFLSGNIFLSVRYHGSKPKKALNFLQENGKVTQVWTATEPRYSRNWFPCLDLPSKKAKTLEQVITVPKPWKVLANGLLKGQTETEETVTYSWKHHYPISTYLISILAGELDIIPVNHPIDISYWVPQSHISEAKLGFRLTPQMMDYYSKNLMEYPFEKYAVGVAHGFRGAMEHTTATTFASNMTEPGQGLSPSVNAHELAHHWFGDTVTNATWADLWLNEGFASLFDVLFWEEHEGRDKALARFHSYKARYLDAAQKAGGIGKLGPIYNEETSPEEQFDVLRYQKAALVLNTLRHQVGHDKFFEALRGYLQEYKFKNATTKQFQASIEKVLGPQQKFFDQWVYKGGLPQLKYKWSYRRKDKVVELTVEQVQKHQVYDVKMDVYVSSNKRLFRYSIPVSKRKQTFKLASERPSAVELDPFKNVLTYTKAFKLFPEWRYILKNSRAFTSKMDAVDGLDGQFTLVEVKELLAKETQVPLLLKVLGQVQHFSPEEARPILEPYFTNIDSQLRIQVLKVVAITKDEVFLPKVLDMFTNDENWRVSMQAAITLGELGNPAAVKVLLEEFDRPRRGYLLSSVVEALGKLGDKQAVPKLLEYMESVAQSMRPRSKLVTLQALGRLKDPRSVEPLGKMMVKETSDKVLLAYIDTFKELKNPAAIPYLQVIAADGNKSPEVRKAAQDLIQLLGS